ncbi:MAG: chromosome segregation protein SMC [Candidatus Zixiibacteriota bacterium]|nr:MAG: chromosome segregation protein SMC [candidate division Zixibacteria bacterium]
MYLKRLELLGFKSFPDKTVIKYTPGVTSIVGPNGCGKTNILDSIRWVLGEQRVSLLRGSKMEEVIFNGTREVKPLGMAEVTLVIQNNKGLLPTEYSEVQITRRLFRSGESEYLLNKVPCRLKDIADLLMDTGVGSHVYSVIQQDMTEAILSDRADERRFLFEEAAGISKYKNRKRAALRKLEATESDLLRLRDIVAEITTQVNSLRRQMNKAQRYQDLSEELKGWEIFLGKSSAEALVQERKRLLAERDRLSDDRVKCETSIETLSATQEKERMDLTDLDKRLAEISNEIFEKSEAAHSVEKEITVLNERRENARQLKEKNLIDVEAFKKRKAILLEQIEETESDQRNLDDELVELGREVTEAEGRLSEADEELLKARQKREGVNKDLIDLEGRLSAGKTDDTNLARQKDEVSRSISDLVQQSQELEAEKRSLSEKKSGLESEISDLNGKLKQLQTTQLNTEGQIAGLDNQLDELSGKIFDLSAALEAAEARCHLLEEMVMHYEGYSSGVVAVMENKGRWPGLTGTVADNLTPRPGFEDAIEAALGEIAGFMICRDRATAEDIVNYLRNENKGKAGLLIIDGVTADTDVTRPSLDRDDFLGWADDHAVIPEEMAGLARLVLSRVAVIKPESANSTIEQLPPYFSAVSTDGKLYQGKAIISGGSREGISMLGRKEKIAEQIRAIDELRTEIQTVKESRNSLTSSLGAKQAELSSLASEEANLKEEIDDANRRLTELRFEIQTAENELARIGGERQTLSEKLEALTSRQYSLSLDYDQLAKDKDTLIESINHQDGMIKELEAESSGAETAYSNLQIKQIEQKSRKQQLESQLAHNREIIAELESNITGKSEEALQADSEIGAVGDKIVHLEGDLKQIFDARAGVVERQSILRQDYAILQEYLDAREKEIKTFRQSREEVASKLHSHEIRIAEIDSEMKSVKQKIRDEHSVDLDDVSPAPPNTDLSPDDRVNRMHELRERMRDFGAVNLLALEEFEAARERQEFLTAQMNDLLNAKSTLQSTISKINQTAKRLFLETFERVRTNFREVFEELFTGGEADIRLLNEDDPLESPIEITARPRGKRLLSIAQMSGGERALTAISLLFAIYLAKPSPFCILDEIDAPLDDANIHRFLKLIRTFSEQTQFIIITHNKITMEAADILYGITMEQPGVSRVVSVRFNEEDDSPLINTSITDDDEGFDDEIPAAVRDRITPKININPADNPDQN